MPTTRRTIIAGALAVAASLLLGAEPPKRLETPARDKRKDHAAKPLSPEAIRDILRFRHENGSLLEGTIFNEHAKEVDERAFIEALRSVAAGSPPAPRLPNSPVARSAGKEKAGTSARSSDTLDQRLVAALDQAAMLLDQKIHQLETEGKYEEAQSLRRTARRVRRSARRWRAVPASHGR